MNNYPIEHVLPHEHPMILLDTLLCHDSEGATCSVTIRPDSPFYNEQQQGVPVYVGIEYMAQTIAAFANANKLDHGEAVALGFLVSSRKYTTAIKQFALGQTFTIHVTKILMGDNGLSTFECVINYQDQPVVEAGINIFQPNDPEAFLSGEKQ